MNLDLDAYVAWTPPGSWRAVGTVLIPKQATLRPITAAQYRGYLAARIDRLVSKEDPEDANYLLRVVEETEKLMVADRPETAGEILVENSDWLLQRAAFPGEPVWVTEDDPETKEALRDETLEDFLARLYYVPRE